MKHMQNFIHTPPETKTSMAESFDLSTNMGEKKKNETKQTTICWETNVIKTV